MRIKKIRIQDFKRIRDVTVHVDEVNLLIGGNNSGKSSALQAVHFAITCLRSAKMYGKSATQPATTLGINQFSYLPTSEIMRIRHHYPMTQDYGPKFTFTYVRQSGAEYEFTLQLKRGKNANVSLNFSSLSWFFNSAADIARPFSIYVPGLAGLSLLEERRANAVITSGLAQGDSNLYLRNVLHRLTNDENKLKRFHEMINPMFPGLEISTQFDEDVNQYISSDINSGGYATPLELAGTGALQALQLAAYVALYEPKLLLLDEPDAHLHPGNQKQLVDLVFEIASQSETQIIMASHSRHVLDRVKSNPLGAVIWFKAGEIAEAESADLPLLLDIGALDRFEELSKAHVKKLIFCEDAKTAKLTTLLEANGILEKDVHIVPFNGVDNMSAAEVVVSFFMKLGPDRRALVYRDGDGMTLEEKAWLKGKAQKHLPEGAKLYISNFTDVEHPYCQPAHVAEIAKMPISDAEAIVSKCIDESQAMLASKLTAKRTDLKNKVLKNCDVTASTEDIVADGIDFEYALGKILIGKIARALEKDGNAVGTLYKKSAALKDDELSQFFE